MTSSMEFARGDDVVFGPSLVGDGYVFLPRERLVRLSKIRSLLEGDPTWGELRAVLDATDLEEIRSRAEDGLIEADLPTNCPVASIPSGTLVGRVSGYDDRDWPTLPDEEVLAWIPDDVIEAFGEVVSGFTTSSAPWNLWEPVVNKTTRSCLPRTRRVMPPRAGPFLGHFYATSHQSHSQVPIGQT